VNSNPPNNLYTTHNKQLVPSLPWYASTGTINLVVRRRLDVEALTFPEGWKLLNRLAINPLRPPASNLNFGALVLDWERE